MSEIPKTGFVATRPISMTILTTWCNHVNEVQQLCLSWHIIIFFLQSVIKYFTTCSECKGFLNYVLSKCITKYEEVNGIRL